MADEETTGTTAPVETQETTETPVEQPKVEEAPRPVPPTSRAEARIHKLVQERNALRAELEQTKKAATAPPEDEDDNVGQAKKLIRDTVSEMLGKEGVSLNQLKELVTQTSSLASDSAERKWESICAEVKLDPKNADIQDFVGGAVSRGVALDKAVGRAVEIFGQSKRAASVENGSLTPSGINSDLSIWDKKAAQEAAAKGIKGRQIPIDEILARTSKKEQAAR